MKTRILALVLALASVAGVASAAAASADGGTVDDAGRAWLDLVEGSVS